MHRANHRPGANGISTGQLANGLTGLRIVLTIPTMALILNGSRTALAGAAVLFGIGGLTDLLDGYTARRWQHVSRVGAFLDPLADKFLIDGSMIALARSGDFPAALAILFIGRDLAVTALRGADTQQANLLTPGQLAKAKTLILFVGIDGVITARFAGQPMGFISRLLVGSAAAMSVASAVQYVKRLTDRRTCAARP